MRRYIASSALVLLSLGGCNALDERAPAGADGSRLFIPVDTRPVQQALRTPPPISGGTLAVSADGAYAVAADPDRDRISIVELASSAVHHIELAEGEEPGRVIIDANLRAHVALRRSGEVLRVDVAGARVLGRTRVCAAPRGLAHEAGPGFVHVACADGHLVTLDAQAAVVRSVDVGTDLRDVVVSQGELLVTTFKAAELIRVDAEGSELRRIQPPRVEVHVEGLQHHTSGPELRMMQPHLAYRAVQQPDGSVLMLHQQASESMVDIDAEPSADNMSSYGGGGGSACSSIVQSGITQIGVSGTRAMSIGVGVLAVDLARSPRDGSLVVALPGNAEPDVPRPTVVFQDGEGASAMVASAGPGFGPGHVAWFEGGMFGSAPLQAGEFIGCQFPHAVSTPGQTTAVAFTPDGTLVTQSREPALLVVLQEPPWGQQTVVDLGGASVRDTGHDLFHRDSGAGIACASCHGEGGDDGHTWLFSGIGARRTQAVHVGLEGTAPFHWDGEMSDLSVLMEEVFVGRMGGVHQSEARLDALSRWLFALAPPPPSVAADNPAAERGRALFESTEVGCASCHSGDRLTNNESYDVGTGERGELLQVPSLRGVAYRAPFIHDGCAETLRDRFDPSCGGDQHGETSALTDAELDDLIAYLRSL